MKNCLTVNNRALITNTAVRKTDTRIQDSLNEHTRRFTLFRAQELEKAKTDVIFQTAY